MVGSINSHRVMYYLWVFDVLSSFCFLSAQYCQFFQSHSPLCLCLQRQGQHLFLLKEKLKLSFPLAAGAQETVTLHSK